jgi:hypothetical protein
MKALLGSMLCAASAALLISCATVPEPTSPQEYLVIGRFSLDCPTGFFGSAIWRIDSQVKLVFRDVESGTLHRVYTDRGWFAFVGSGRGGYTLESSSYASSIGTPEFVLGPRSLSIWNCAEPGKVIYLGEIRMVYVRRAIQVGPPGRLDQPDYKVVEGWGMGSPTAMSGPPARVNETYDVTLDRRWDTAAAAAHLGLVSPASTWRSRDTVSSGS